MVILFPEKKRRADLAVRRPEIIFVSTAASILRRRKGYLATRNTVLSVSKMRRPFLLQRRQESSWK